MSRSAPVHDAPRRTLSERQARTVQKLTEATTKELRATGYEGLTVRGVAKRAGVAAATAYTYFASREHLICEAFWRRLQTLPAPTNGRRRATGARVEDALRVYAELAEVEPELMAACTVAMVTDDPDVKRLRDRVGADIHSRLVAALGDDADPDVLTALDLAMTGAMIRAGTGHMTYAEIPGRIAGVAALLTEQR